MDVLGVVILVGSYVWDLCKATQLETTSREKHQSKSNFLVIIVLFKLALSRAKSWMFVQSVALAGGTGFTPKCETQFLDFEVHTVISSTTRGAENISAARSSDITAISIAVVTDSYSKTHSSHPTTQFWTAAGYAAVLSWVLVYLCFS